ncbi:MAG: hypothetical protein IPJ71_19600 [Bdellovibrionales bacterium]|nr:hypothetical protein [Bdellovibrionales bacterium]
MTDTDISNFRAGYNEARSIAMGRIKEIVSLPNGHLAALKRLIKKLEKRSGRITGVRSRKSLLELLSRSMKLI